MLPAAFRMTCPADFTAALRRGQRSGRGHLVVHVLALSSPAPRSQETLSREPPAPPRVGFVVSRIVGGAVVRNRVRRRLRHLVRARLQWLPPAALVVVRALPTAATASSTALGANLDAALDAVLDRSPPDPAVPAGTGW